MKKLLSIVLAIMLMLSIIPLGIVGATAATEKVTVAWQDTSKWCEAHGFTDWSAFIASMSGEGTEASPYIITTAEQLYYLTNVGSTYDNTTGKFFKVADNIGAFNFMNNADATPETTSSELLNGNTSWNKYYNESAVFAGTFDGNGAVVYNLIHTGNKAGLFPCLGKNAVIKNVSVAASVFISKGGEYAMGAGGIFGQVIGAWDGSSITIENCKVTNCYIEAMEYSAGYTFGAGVIGGYAHALVVKIENCFVADNIINNASNGSVGGLIATGYSASSSVKNTVALGVTPYNKWAANIVLQNCAYQNFANATYSNVYTDMPKTDCYTDQANTTLRTFTDDQIKVISAEDIKGSGAKTEMSGLDWSSWIAVDGKYPEVAALHNLAITVNGVDGHTIACTDTLDGVACSVASSEAHTLSDSEDGLSSICVCGYSVEKSGIVVSWKDTSKWHDSHGFTDWDAFIASMSGEGTEESPYIISTAEQLYYLTAIGSTVENTTGKYFKVADAIVAFNFMNNSDTTIDTTAEELKSGNTTWNKFYSENAVFAGNFDGNGAIVYNYIKCGNKPGLFVAVGPNTVIKNITVAASVFISSEGPYSESAGAIIGQTKGSWGSTVTVENCVVKNCLIEANGRTGQTDWYGAGAIAGAPVGFKVIINNCLVSDNIVNSNAQGVNGALIGFTAQVPTITNTIVLGMMPYPTLDEGFVGVGSELWDITNMTDSAAFKAVYTDQTIDTEKYSADRIKTVDDVKGTAGVEAMADLDWVNGWIATEDIPEIRAFHNLSVVDNGDGTHSESCADCEIATIALAHNYVDGVCDICGNICAHSSVEFVEKTAATCTENAKGDKVCNDCGAIVNSDVEKENSALGHKNSEPKVENNVDATCLTAGSYETVITCTVCGEEVSRETTVIDALGHTSGDAVEENRKESTCTTAGSYDLVKYCTVCGEEVSRETIALELNSDAHSYDDDKDADCNECGATRELYKPGDINDDGALNNKDLGMLMQYINNWYVEINIDAADVNNDDKINNKDYGLLMQFINGWDVKLG